LNNFIHTNDQQINSIDSTISSLWPLNTVCEKNDDYKTYESIHQQETQQPILIHQRQQGDNSTLSYTRTIQMGDNNISEQRQFSGVQGGNNANSNNVVSRKRTNNRKKMKTKTSLYVVLFFSRNSWRKW